MLTEFSCSEDSILDLTTGACLPLTCDASCTADGLYQLNSAVGKHFIVQFLDPTSYAFEESENIFTDVKLNSAGHWELTVPEDKQWVNAGEFLGFSGKIFYRWESVDNDTESNIDIISDNLDDQSLSDMDAADASSLGKHYHLEYFGYRPTFYDIGNTCTKEQAGMTITAVIHVRKNKKTGFIVIFVHLIMMCL